MRTDSIPVRNIRTLIADFFINIYPNKPETGGFRLSVVNESKGTYLPDSLLSQGDTSPLTHRVLPGFCGALGTGPRAA